MMAFIGVRISWLMLARNALFARLAASAALRAVTRSAVRSATSISRWLRWASSSKRARRLSVMSIKAPCTREIKPCRLRTASASTRTHTRRPLAVMICSSSS